MTFDADFIIIGSGPSGVSAALPLVDAGRRVLMIDGSVATSEAMDDGGRPRWQRMLGDRLEALRPDDRYSPKLRTPVARGVVEPFQTWANFRTEDFHALGSLARGGLSRIWGALVSELDDNDLQGWPLRFSELERSYRAVSSRIGVSGSSDDDMAGFYGRSAPILPAPPIGPTAATVLNTYRRRSPTADFSLGLARNALLTAQHAGRPGCNFALDCLWGCSRGAIYDARQDLAQLATSPHFCRLDGARALRLASTSDGWNVVVAGREDPLRSRRVLLAAGALGTMRLVVPVLGNAPASLPLINSPVLAIPMLIPQRLGAAPPDSGYTLAQLGFSYGYSPTPGDFVTGALYEVAGLPPSSLVVRMPFGRRAGTQLFRFLAPALAIANVYFPGKYSANTMHAERRCAELVISIRGGFSNEFPSLRAAVCRRLSRIWRHLGAYVLPGTALATPGHDAHLGGIFPMGDSKIHGTSVYGELNGAAGLHLVDGSILPTISSKPMTLTIMANADRIARHLAKSA
jgi:choline dehydrogenase-like flavoprotein